MHACFKSSEILLPKKEYRNNTWAVVACDQFTSEPEYWKQVQELVNEEPSTLHMIYPEAFLSEGDSRITKINATMESYMNTDIIEQVTSDGFILVDRETLSGNRIGLVGKLDLDTYEYKPGADSLVRATEQTVESRIPPRVKIRENAPLELPHVLVLINDTKKEIIKPLIKQTDQFPLVYDMNLNQNGGEIKGYLIEGKKAEEINALLYKQQEESNGLFLVIGDGNHSLATAKTCWETIKKDLSEEERIHHPARYALVELVNLYSSTMQFEPIHRLLFHVDANDVYENFMKYLFSQDMITCEGDEITFASNGVRKSFNIVNKQNRIPVEILQTFLDAYLEEHTEASIDYIHGEEAILKLASQENNCGIMLTSIHKEDLFPSILNGHVLPRKTFSIGEAQDKRYYMEARKIK